MRTLTGLLSWLKPWHVQTSGYCFLIGSDLIRQIALYEKTLVEWMSRTVGIALGEGLCDSTGDNFGWRPPRLEGRRARSPSNCTLAFALQKRKSTQNLSQLSRVVLDTTRCVDLATFLRAASAGLLNISPPRLTVADFRQPLVGTCAFQVADLRVSPQQLTLSRKSRLVPWCFRRRVESPSPRESVCH
jgi:hypothetical protein